MVHGVYERMGQFVAQRGGKYAAAFQQGKRLQFNPVSAGGRSRPPWLAGPSHEVARCIVDVNIDCGQRSERYRCRCNSSHEIGTSRFQRSENNCCIIVINCSRVGDAKVFAGEIEARV